MKKIKKELKIKQEQEKIKLKENKGITLIALVITIIVLLILAGVSIAMLTGENGILSQATKAKEETEKAQANEALILDEYNKFLNNAVGGPTVELLFKSYNQKYGTKYVAEATSNTGYMIGENGTADSYYFYLSNTSDPLYVITSNANAAA